MKVKRKGRDNDGAWCWGLRARCSATCRVGGADRDPRRYAARGTALSTPHSTRHPARHSARSTQHTAPLLLELLDHGLGLRGFRRRRIGGHHFLERLDGGVLVALVQLHQRQLEERLAPRGIEVRGLLVILRRLVGLAL